MKKTRIIVAVVAAALMVMGIGYAATAWSQPLPLKVGSSLYNLEVTATSVTDEHGSVPGAIIAGGKTVEITPPTLYPGIPTKTYTVVLTNSGTLDAKITSISIDATGRMSDVVIGMYEQGHEADKAEYNTVDSGTMVLAPENQRLLAKGESITLIITVDIGEEAVNYATDANRNFNFNFTPVFTQVNPT